MSIDASPLFIDLYVCPECGGHQYWFNSTSEHYPDNLIAHNVCSGRPILRTYVLKGGLLDE